MVNKKFFGSLLENYISYNQKRHSIIKKSADILRNSKQAIFTLHRDNIKDAELLVKSSENSFKELEQWFKKEPRLRYEGSYQAASEEYAESKLLLNYLKNGKIDSFKETKLDFETYLGGICDFTGELVRKAISAATAGQFKAVEKYRETVGEIMGELIRFDMTGKLRSKYDDARRNLRKLEEVGYDIAIKARK